MRFCRSVFSFALMAWQLALCAPAFAQVDPGQWVGDLYMVMVAPEDHLRSAVFVGDDDDVSKVVPNVREVTDFPEICQACGSNPWWSRWHGGALHALADGPPEKDADGAEFRRHAFVRWQEDGGWSLLGTLSAGRKEQLEAVPCDGNRYIVVSDKTDFIDNRRPDRSPFCRMSVGEDGGGLRLDASIDHGQDDLRKYMSSPDCFSLAIDSDVIMTEGRATLVNRKTGLYWVFSTETARLVKAGSIFKNVTPEMIVRGGFYGAVLCANPEKSGTVLVSAQDEDLFTVEKEDAWKEMHERWEQVPFEQKVAGGNENDWINEIFERRLEEIKARSPLIVWYRIYPESGRVERLATPPEGGAAFREGEDNEWWRPMSDGSVKMGWNATQYQLKGQASKWSNGPKGEGAAKEADGAEESGEAAPLEGDVAGTGEGKGNAPVG